MPPLAELTRRSTRAAFSAYGGNMGGLLEQDGNIHIWPALALISIGITSLTTCPGS
jgi:hypothetical protein